jgi:predicted RNA-binding protein associated with RNAse of E/G family
MTGAPDLPLVHIHYRRPPDRHEVFRQHLVLDSPDAKVTFARDLHFEPPITIGDEVVLETGSDAVWFTFPEAWHDIGRFHRADGRFTGVYANVITPCRFERRDLWHTTDLFLDVWIDPEGAVHLLDEDEYADAVQRKWLDDALAERALREARELKEKAEAGSWPPPIVSEWTRERALAAVEG